MKACGTCKRTKPFEAFYPRKRKDGSVGYRSVCRACDASQARMRGVRGEVKTNPTACGPDLPVGPLREWLDKLEREFDLPGDMAEYLHISERRLYAWRHEQESVRLGALDAMLCACAMPHKLIELYPELYPDEEMAA